MSRGYARWICSRCSRPRITLPDGARLKAEVRVRLNKHWSPQQIAPTLRQDFPDDPPSILLGIFPRFARPPLRRPIFSWNYTTYLNIVFLALFGFLYWTYRNRERLGAGTAYAEDPVGGMQVEIAHAPASLRHGGERIYFCSDHCADHFGAEPEENQVVE